MSDQAKHGPAWNEPTQVMCRVTGFGSPGMTARMQAGRQRGRLEKDRGRRLWLSPSPDRRDDRT